MYLSRFGVKNYKCLGDIDIPLTPIHVLIGENDAGKTSLLEAIEAFCMCEDGLIGKWFPQPWSDKELVNFKANKPEIEFSSQWMTNKNAPFDEHAIPPFECRFTVEFDPLGIKDEKINPTIKKIGQIFQAKASFSQGAKVQLFFQKTDVGDIKLIHPAKRYVFEPSVMAKPSAISASRRFQMESNGTGLVSLLDDILGNDPKKFIHLQETYTDMFPQFTNIQLESCELPKSPADDIVTRNRIGKALFLGTHNGNRVRAEQISNGAILMLGFLALAYLPEPPNLLLIEEPENGIYPKRLGEIITLLKELVNRTEGVRFPQIIMTTHSPYLLSYFQPDEVTFLSRPKNDPSGPVRARPLRDAPHINERMGGGEFYLGELWYNLSEEELFCDELKTD